MPLDHIVANQGQDRTVDLLTPAGCALGLGIVPVSLDLLDSHCQRMVRAHSVPAGAGRWHPIGVSALGGLLAALVAVAGASPEAWVIVTLGGIAAAFAAAIRSARTAQRSVSWVEREIPAHALDRSGIPASIRSIAGDIRRQVPGARFVLGELRRKSVVLDPYLIVERDAQRIVLGIWDDEQVTACARRI